MCYLQPLTIDEIHTNTLEILKKLILICDSLKINYFMAYGTLIGTVRHKGFIPWDDDCDIIMLRPEYDKFIKYCIEHESEISPFKVMSRKNIAGYPYAIARFCDTRYTMVTQEHKDIGMGMFIDIYPFDGAGKDDSEAVLRFEQKKKIIMKFLYHAIRDNVPKSPKGGVYNFLHLVMFMIGHCIGQERILNIMESFSDKYAIETSKYIACMVWNDRIIPVEKKNFESYELLPFCELTVKVPKDYDVVLQASYGDYMKLPPKNQQVFTHSYSLYRKESEI